jgi:hypothetical protein
MRFTTALIIAGMMMTPVAAEPFRFAVMGDTPYYLPGDMPTFERLIDRINEESPVFSIHVGDIKSGSSECSDAAFRAVHDRFMRISGALFYTPGDNEWTDCHRSRAGGYDPLERLATIRAMFFGMPVSLGQSPLSYSRQSDFGNHPHMVENAIWRHKNVVFATVHVVGSNNGFERTVASKAEWELRDRANKDWIRAAFKQAADQDAKAIVIAIHANPDFESKKSRTSPGSGFRRTLKALAKRSKDYARPVLIVHGDHHRLIVDQPVHNKDGDPVPNVTRLQVMGADEVGAVFVTVDPEADRPFSFGSLVMD